MRLITTLLLAATPLTVHGQEARVRARDLGVAPGIFTPGAWNAITDVAGVTVVQATGLSEPLA